MKDLLTKTKAQEERRSSLVGKARKTGVGAQRKSLADKARQKSPRKKSTTAASVPIEQERVPDKTKRRRPVYRRAGTWRRLKLNRERAEEQVAAKAVGTVYAKKIIRGALPSEISQMTAGAQALITRLAVEHVRMVVNTTMEIRRGFNQNRPSVNSKGRPVVYNPSAQHVMTVLAATSRGVLRNLGRNIDLSKELEAEPLMKPTRADTFLWSCGVTRSSQQLKCLIPHLVKELMEKLTENAALLTTHRRARKLTVKDVEMAYGVMVRSDRTGAVFN